MLYNHASVKHSAKEYVNGMINTNGIESVWALIKRGYTGTFHHFSMKHCQRYKELGMFYKGIHRTDILQRTDIGKLPVYNSKSNKSLLYGEQGGNCRGCGTHFEKHHLEVDRVIAKSKGGPDHIENLQLLCSSCNRTKGNRGQEYLIAKLAA